MGCFWIFQGKSISPIPLQNKEVQKFVKIKKHNLIFSPPFRKGFVVAATCTGLMTCLKAVDFFHTNLVNRPSPP